MKNKLSDLTSSRRQFIVGGTAIAATTVASAVQVSEAMSAKQSNITNVASKFFEACETGKGWEACKEYCQDSATFSGQADALGGLETVEAYTDWWKGMMTILTDGTYDIKFFAVDSERNSVCAFAVFEGSHIGEGGPVPPTGKKAISDYVYHMQFEGDRISHLTKIWNDVQAVRQLGWA
jgi:predicted ester cyclase